MKKYLIVIPFLAAGCGVYRGATDPVLVEKYSQIATPVIEEMKKDINAGVDWETLLGAIVASISGALGIVTFTRGTPNNRKGTVNPNRIGVPK